jgi:head-tail adaptor
MDHELLVSEWETQLDAAQADIAALHGKVLTQEDVEMMRAKVRMCLSGRQDVCGTS